MIQTVTGAISPEELGITSAHEHIFIDMRHCVGQTGEEPPVFFQPITLENRGLCFADPYAILDNALLDEFEKAVQEVLWFKEAGGNTLIDCTLDEIGRDPLALKKIAEQTGVNIIAGCGNYYHIAHPEFVAKESAQELAARMRRDIYEGIGGTEVRAGIIGEIGTSAIMTADEKKVLKAAGMVGAESGLPIHVHTDLYTENGFEVIDILQSEGVEPRRICIDHVDVWLRPDYIKGLLDRGVYVEFDNFGKEFYCSEQRRFAYDLERIRLLKELIDQGYQKQILVSNDICLKTMWRSYGGTGYAHMLQTVARMAEQNGIGAAYRQIITQNVKNFFE